MEGVRNARSRALLLACLALASVAPAAANRLEAELGRNEVRLFAAPHRLEPGVALAASLLPGRLEALGYQRVHRRPERPGEYFWGHERFWIFRREHRAAGRRHRAALLGLDLERSSGLILAVFERRSDGSTRSSRAPWLEPALLGESLDADRAPRRPIRLAELPEYSWRSVLAIEDARFFEHPGVDARSVARAALRNARAGRVTQGGSTITQQLIKVRDLTPRRTFGRKLSEAVRALALEAEFSKEEILEAYLNSVYFGHLDGVALYGYGVAAEAYFGKSASELGLGEAAMLAGVIQGPNRLHPLRNPEPARARQLVVLQRLTELGWASSASLAAARRTPPAIRARRPSTPAGRHFVRWVAEWVRREVPTRAAEGRGLVVETTLDPLLQRSAERVVGARLATLRRAHPRLARAPLSAALVALDASTGRVLAYVAGDPGESGDAFDRARKARRQPGSTVKPFVLLEAFGGCGRRSALYPARRVADRPLVLELESGPWRPRNPDGRHRGVVDLRQTLVQSLNVPLVRVARWCGFEKTAERFREAGLSLPSPAPPAFTLGAVETTVLDLASAYTAFPGLGRRAAPLPVRRISTPSGRKLEGFGERRRRVAPPAAAYIVLDLLRETVAAGTARAAGLDGFAAYGKTGTSSDRRDAWFAGGVGRVVTAVWVGLDDSRPLGLGGSEAAAPLWRAFMEEAAGVLPQTPAERPLRVVERWVEDSTGLLVAREREGARRELFIRGKEPPRRRFYRRDDPVPVLE